MSIDKFQPNLSLMSLFEVGAQRGGSKSKLNPKLKEKIYSTKDGYCVIDLVQTIDSINNATDFFYNLGKNRKQVLIVGTYEHVKNYVPELSKMFSSVQMPYVNYRWLGGTLSNWTTIRKTLRTLEKIENIESNQEFYDSLSRNEKLNLRTQKKRISKFFEGLKTLRNNRPGAVLVLDTFFNPIAIKEAEKNGVPVVALSNTNSVYIPKNSKGLIVCNTNSIKSVELICKNLVNAYNSGLVSKIEEKKDS